MKKRAILTLCCVAGLLLCFAPCALAQDCTEGQAGCLTLTSAGNNVMDNIYVGPYTAQVGSNVGQQIICDDFADESEIGNGWATTANTFSSIGNTLWGQYYGVATATTLYQEAAWITLQMLSGSYNSTQIGYMSYAIWYIFDANGTAKNSIGVNQWAGVAALLGSANVPYSGLLWWVAQAQANYGSLTAAQLSKFVIYTPNGCTLGPGSCAGQEFMMLVPEGGAALMYLLLAGVSCFGAMFFRSRNQRAKPGMA